MVKTAQAEGAETLARARTRRVILRAAVEVLGADRAAPLSEVARAAGVSRSTLQRYFPERVDLLGALDRYAGELVEEAVARARTDEGTAVEAAERLVAELFALSVPLMLTTEDAGHGGAGAEGSGSEEDETPADLRMCELAERGHEDGTLDPRVTPLWFRHLLWTTLYAGWTHRASDGVSGYEALRLTVHSFLKAVEHRGQR